MSCVRAPAAQFPNSNVVHKRGSGGILRRFGGDRSGALAPIFAASISFLVLVMTTAVEFGRWAVAKVELQAALDAAVLAGAAKLQANGADKAGAIAAAEAAFNANRNKQRFASDITENITFSISGTSVMSTGTASIATVLGKVVNVDSLDLLGNSGATGKSETGSVATITNSKFELSIMLDITGSMCDVVPGLNDNPCTKGVKLDGMKSAATNLVNTMLASTELQSRVRVAVVPFSDGVRLPAAPRLVAAGLTPTVKTFSENYQSCDNRGRNCETKTRYHYYHPTDCVAERTGTNKYSDDAPGANNYVMTAMREGSSLTNSTAVEYGCSLGSSSVVMPLTNNKSTLVSTIQGLSAKGGTAGHLGTAWTWYTLSPNWKDVWSGSSDDPAAYPAASDKTLRKIAILMTDGDYNNQFSLGGYKVDSYAYGVSGGAANAASQTQALELCKGMKGKGIEVYTVGFAVSSAAKTFLETCATDGSHAFTAETATELSQVFEGIGQRVLALYLSK